MGFPQLQLIYLQKPQIRVMQIDHHILIRYFLKQASEEEKESIQQWMKSNEENRKTFIRERIRFDASILVDENAIKTISPTGKTYRLHPIIRWSIKIAASVLLLLGTIYGYDMYRFNRLSQTFQCVSAPAGNRSNILLPDGTSVWLNANSSLRYPLAFSQKERRIELDGEGYFEVSKDQKPFIVQTNKYDIRVLGTTFNVEAYSNNSHFRTILYEGKIKLYNAEKNESLCLAPGQTAELKDGKLQVSSTTEPNSYRWKDGLIYIEDKSFDEIMALFEKYYNVNIVIQSQKVRKLEYRGKLRISDGVDHALRVLQNDFPFKYKRNEEENLIYIN